MKMIKFSLKDFKGYKNIEVSLKMMRNQLVGIRDRCTVVDTVQDYSTGFPRTIRIETVLQDRYRRQAAATEAGIIELEQRRDIIYRTITTACGEIDMRMYTNVYLYIVCGYPMDMVAMRNNCDRSTVSRDIAKFFKTCKKYYDAVAGCVEEEAS